MLGFNTVNTLITFRIAKVTIEIDLTYAPIICDFTLGANRLIDSMLVMSRTASEIKWCRVHGIPPSGCEDNKRGHASDPFAIDPPQVKGTLHVDARPA